MIRRILFLVFVIQTSNVFSWVNNENTNKNIQLSPECKKIKCPPVSEPLCVRLKYVTSAMESRTVYVVMINRCELKYVTCHNGAEAKVLPMSYCNHRKNITTDLKTLVERRPKIDLKTLSTSSNITHHDINKTSGYPEMSTLVRHKRKAVDNNQRNTLRADNKKNKIAKKHEEMAHINEVKRQLFKHGPLTKNKKSNKKLLRQSKKEKNIKKLPVYKNAKNRLNAESGSEDNEGPAVYVYTKEHNGDFNDSKEIYEEEKDGDDSDIFGDDDGGGKDGSQDAGGNNNDKSNEDDEENASQWTDRYEYAIHSAEFLKLDAVDMENYKADCPKMCPARGVMVCGRCKDGVYRTFLSTCHMRMFECGSPDEKLTLVARYPCAMSGPYLEDLRVPKGRIDEFDDEDVVLRFLKCREYKNKALKPYSKLNCTFD